MWFALPLLFQFWFLPLRPVLVGYLFDFSESCIGRVCGEAWIESALLGLAHIGEKVELLNLVDRST